MTPNQGIATEPPQLPFGQRSAIAHLAWRHSHDLSVGMHRRAADHPLLPKGRAPDAGLDDAHAKALLLVDVPGIPVLSLYRFLMAMVLVMYLMTLALARKGSVRKGPFFNGLMLFLGVAAVSVLMNIGSASAGLLTWIALCLEVGVPVLAFSHFAGGLGLAEAKRLLRVYVVFFSLLAVYAIAAYLVNWNPYIDFINSTTQTGRVMARTYADTLQGMRAQGTTSHPITYGALVAIMLLTYYVARLCGQVRMRDMMAMAAVSGCIIISMLFTNSRSPLMLYFFALLVFGVSVGIVRSLKYSLLGGMAFVIALATSNVFLEKVLSVVNIFDASVGAEQNGSDLAMRAGQFAVSLSYFWQSPLGLGSGRDSRTGGRRRGGRSVRCRKRCVHPADQPGIAGLHRLHRLVACRASRRGTTSADGRFSSNVHRARAGLRLVHHGHRSDGYVAVVPAPVAVCGCLWKGIRCF